MSLAVRSSKTHRAHRLGFTLIELLVVMLIIGILMALILPAVNATRESARSTQSKNNLKQMALAMQNFNSAKAHYPPSYYCYEYNAADPASNALQYWNTYDHLEGWSIHTLLLPYLEQKIISGDIDYSKPYNYFASEATANPSGAAPPTFVLADGTNVRLGTIRVPAYVSPAEPRDEIRDNLHHPINYVMNLGTWFVWDPLTGKGGNGAAYPNSKLRDGAFNDGLGTTLAFAEVKAWNPYFRDTYRTDAQCGATPPNTLAALGAIMGTPAEYKATAHTEWFNGHAHHAGFTTVCRPNQKVMCGNSGSTPTVNATGTGDLDVDWTNKQEGKNHFADTPERSPTYAAITARSYFKGGVNVAMMDGSVRNVEDNINLGVWRAISTRNSSERLPNSFGQQ